MRIEKEDVINLARKTIKEMWLTDKYISKCENGITLICGGFEGEIVYDGQDEDLEKIMKHIHEFDDFKFENLCEILNKYDYWNYMDGYTIKNQEECIG